jgi:DNA polymerase-3 subunit epsilon
MRQIVLDTETTGLELAQGHRIIEIACVELVNRRPTGRHFHHYLNPERDIDAGAVAVHGLLREQLASAPRFGDIAHALLEFITGSELIIHNAAFDLGFLDMELALLARAQATSGAALLLALDTAPLPSSVSAVCPVLDTLALARERHPGQRNNLDALCKRYGIDASHRELHGALLDARLLADVYLSMTGGQSVLAFEEVGILRDGAQGVGAVLESAPASRLQLPQPLRIIEATAVELVAHAKLVALLQKSSGGRCIWTRWQPQGAQLDTRDASSPQPVIEVPKIGNGDAEIATLAPAMLEMPAASLAAILA